MDHASKISALVVCLLIAGCGGQTSSESIAKPQRLPQRAFVRAADSACFDVNRELANIAQSKTGIARNAGLVIAMTSRGLQQLDEIRPPQRSNRTYLSLLQVLTERETQRKQIFYGDSLTGRQRQQVVDRFNQYTASANRQARKLGLSRCPTF